MEVPLYLKFSRSVVILNDKTEKNIVKFINQYKNVKLLWITWFGGEPLLVFDRIIKLTKSIRKKIKIPLKATLITNGYLFNDGIIKKLDKLGINFIQITLDGLKEVHDKRRPLKNSKGTFDVIIKNIEKIVELQKNIAISIRVNIDDTNVNDYHKIYNFIHNRFNKANINVYPGFVENYSNTCVSVNDSCIIDKKKKIDFFLKQYYEYGIYSDVLYPKYNTSSCIARDINGWVIGPRGNLYKCLSVVGMNEMIIGNINNKKYITNDNLLIEFLIGNDYLTTPKCRSCPLFPICNGGCPYLIIKEKLYGEKYDRCHIAKNNLDKFLNTYLAYKNE